MTGSGAQGRIARTADAARSRHQGERVASIGSSHARRAAGPTFASLLPEQVSAVSIMSSNGVAIQDPRDTVGRPMAVEVWRRQTAPSGPDSAHDSLDANEILSVAQRRSQ